MTWWERLKHMFADDAKEVERSLDDLSERLDADLTRREGELQATPEQKLEAIVDEIAANDATFDELRTKTNEAQR